MHTTAALIVLLFTATASAQDRFHYPKPAAGSIEVRRGIEFATAGSQKLTFDLYRPAGNETVPVVVFANVGSLAYPTWSFYKGWGETVAGDGLGGVIYQATTADASGQFDALIAALRERAEELRVDPARIVIWSCSSNVQIGLPLAMDAKRGYIRGAVVEYGDASIPGIRTDLPLLFVRAGLDTPQLNERIDALVGRALAANAPWTVINYGGGLHGFEMLNDNEVTREIIGRELAFMHTVARPHVGRAYADTADDAALGAAFGRSEWAAAIEGYRRRIAAAPGDAESHRRLGIALMGSDRNTEALAALEKAWELGRRGPRDTGLPAAEAAARAGNVARAIHWLDLVLSTPFGPPIQEVRTSATWAPIRKDRRFEELLTGIEEQRRIMEWFESGSGDEASLALMNSRSPRFEREDVLNTIGYRLLGSGHPRQAMAVFALNAERHPKSANAWDSLAEAAEALGHRNDAVSFSRRALEAMANDSRLSSVQRTGIQNAATERVKRLSP